MTYPELAKALHRLKVETGSLACMGCGHEHNCSTQGCAILREAEKLARCMSEHFSEETLRKMLRVPTWTSVAERLPEHGEVGDWCLVYVDGKEGCVTYRDTVISADYDAQNGNFFDGSLCITNLVRYWMPMPEGPEGGKNDA